MIKDPPFSRIDAISCRNVLIYLEADLQKKLLPLFHYALSPSGYLFLGPSENIASRSEYFRAVDQKHRVFQRKPMVLHKAASVSLIDPGQVTKLQTMAPSAVAVVAKEPNMARAIERIIVEDYAPASVIINELGDVVYFAGDTGRFLKPPAGSPTNKLVSLARENLRLEVRTLVNRAVSTGKEVVRKNLIIKSGPGTSQIDLIVRPLTEVGPDAGLFIVLFRELVPSTSAGTVAAEDFASHEHPVFKQLENELRTTREDLQTTIEELETSNEELKSANEELLSMNEELQSANEELQTSKEEVQSANDELQRKIEESEHANIELRRAHQERAEYAAIVENSDDAIIGKTLDGIITSWNGAAERIFGHSAAEIVGQSILRIIPPERHEEETRILQKLRRGERVAHYETQRVTKSGRLIQVSLTSSPIRDPQGFVVGASKVARDITDQTAAVRASMLLAAVVDSSDDAIISKRLDGTITSWNSAAERLFGYTAQEMIGQPITRLFPADRIEEEARIIGQIAKGERVNHFETIRKTKDGRHLNLSLTISPVKDVDGRIVGASKIARDITERKRIEEQLHRSEEQLRLMADSIPQLAWMADPDGNMFWYNRRWYEYTGASPEAMKGWGWQSVHDPQMLPLVVEQWKESLKTGKPFEMEYPLRGGDGRFQWFLTRINPLLDERGRVMRWFGTNTNVDEVRRIRETLVEVNAALDRRIQERTASLESAVEQMEEFSYTVSHDLRAPLRAMHAYAKALIEDFGAQLEPAAKMYAERIMRNSHRMEKLTHEVLTYSRIARADMPLTTVDLSKLLGDLITHYQEFQAPAAQVEIQEPLPAVLAHETSLGQCLTNLLHNAVKFVRPGTIPVVRIHAEHVEEGVRIWIEDNGIGIKPEHQQNIFKLFERAHSEGQYSGTGIGLAIVRKAVERMRGSAGVVSDGVNGSRFWLRLPKA